MVLETFEDKYEDLPKQVIIYGRKSCSPCRSLKYQLTRAGIEYDYIDVDNDPDSFNFVMKQSGVMEVPQTLIKGQVVVGLNVQRIKEIVLS